MQPAARVSAGLSLCKTQQLRQAERLEEDSFLAGSILRLLVPDPTRFPSWQLSEAEADTSRSETRGVSVQQSSMVRTFAGAAGLQMLC